MLNYTDSPSTPQINLPCPDPTISSSGSSPASVPPWCRVQKCGGMPPFTLWLPDASKCTPVWGVTPRLPVPPPPGDITTPHLPNVYPSPLWSFWSPDGETPIVPSTFTPSPPNYHFRIAALTVPPPYTSPHSPAPFLLYLSASSKSSPTTSALSSGFETPPANRYC